MSKRKRPSLLSPPRRTREGSAISPRPTLRFTPPAWAKLCWLRDRGETEIGGFGISAPDDLLRIEDVVLVMQRTTAVSVAFEDAAVADYFEEQVAAGRQPGEIARIWIHTHPGDCPLPSGTDERTFARVFGRCDWAVMLILARGGATYARLAWHVGPGGSLRVPVRVEFTPPFGGSDVPAWAAEYDRCVQPEPLFAEQTDEAFADPFADDFADWPVTARSARRHRPITRRQTRSLIPPAIPFVMEPAFDDPADDLDDDNSASTE